MKLSHSFAKVLILRFSSFGDVVQCLSVPHRLKDLASQVEIHWAVRQDFSELLEGHPYIHRIWALDRNLGMRGLWKLMLSLRREKFTHIYDAHNSLRSRFVTCFLAPSILSFVFPFFSIKVLCKSQKRWWRFLLFRFRINKYRQPFSGQRDLLEPLKKWGLKENLPLPPQIFVDESTKISVKKRLSQDGVPASFTALAPSATHILKRWPLSQWKELIRLHPGECFVVLGGPKDIFLQELSKEFPSQIRNWAGKTSLKETVALIAFCEALITNDTGVLHVAEQLGKACIVMMGPAPFGFPSRPSTKILELLLPCRPCSKHGQGPCINKKYQQCLVDISPEMVSQAFLEHRKISTCDSFPKEFSQESSRGSVIK